MNFDEERIGFGIHSREQLFQAAAVRQGPKQAVSHTLTLTPVSKRERLAILNLFEDSWSK